MIKISSLKSRQQQTSNRMTELKLERMRQELEELNYNISDENCSFTIYPGICLKEKFMAVRLKIVPSIGLYENIDFDIIVYFELEGLSPPKIVNDRRIFHPNLDPYSMEFALKELVEWVPSISVGELFRKLKYTVVEPNIYVIPNNPICRKAAYLYKIDRDNFRSNSIVQFSPSILENIVLKEMNMNNERRTTKKFVEIGDILPMSRLSPVRDTSEDTLHLLSRRFSQMHIEDQENNVINNQRGLNEKINYLSGESMEEENYPRNY